MRGLPIVIGTVHSAEAIASIYEASETGAPSSSDEAVMPDYPSEKK